MSGLLRILYEYYHPSDSVINIKGIIISKSNKQMRKSLTEINKKILVNSMG